MEENRKKKIRVAVAATFLVLLAVYETFLSGKFFSAPVTEMFDGLVTRLLGIIAVVAILGGVGVNLTNKPVPETILAVLPCFLAVICNPPLEGLIFGDAELNYGGAELAAYIVMLAAECLAVGFFEELLFRGALFTFVLENRRENGKKIFLSVVISSAVFALVHLVNLFAASPLSVLLQIGYSFLIGGLCAFALLKTGNVIVCALLHGTFNFCGTLVDTLGAGGWGGIPTIIITSVVGIAVAIYVIYSLLHFPPEDADKLYCKTNDISE